MSQPRSEQSAADEPPPSTTGDLFMPDLVSLHAASEKLKTLLRHSTVGDVLPIDGDHPQQNGFQQDSDNRNLVLGRVTGPPEHVAEVLELLQTCIDEVTMAAERRARRTATSENHKANGKRIDRPKTDPLLQKAREQVMDAELAADNLSHALDEWRKQLDEAVYLAGNIGQEQWDLDNKVFEELDLFGQFADDTVESLNRVLSEVLALGIPQEGRRPKAPDK
ncbi:hypothetical protein GGR57DRAFT_288729 [Xylariaceae sp. FL1272]|nr:hypothetical protein GGR57DRAFT_288729 [Xylariaceae sp. FL1272]